MEGIVENPGISDVVRVGLEEQTSQTDVQSKNRLQKPERLPAKQSIDGKGSARKVKTIEKAAEASTTLVEKRATAKNTRLKNASYGQSAQQVDSRRPSTEVSR